MVGTGHQGYSWTLRGAPPNMLSALPRAVTLSTGPLLVSGGRPALRVWVSEDGTAQEWQTLDIPTEHNKLVADPALRFCPQFGAYAPTHPLSQHTCRRMALC